ncbi:MAG: ubiquinol-cytochrome c reductase iron-sulfur subunit [Gammaproteobacteria bacterium]|nr:ubiquinol-cytochrome c reductase iron-sulfur subunit [Gammaproteobacteria bacterium]MBU0786563.1 ubiquinol-cytochrome c reductase iron-sulfur subunit [Gammaproteobacteria bacterium]MBU0817171.1 ubiquinol-cytochrome c reductase iron-sulfur subunit [Gammaproteobacteria bacterium]MBU1787708.1 ubiquinol-cytochrome c reductase iron-sulfur subunit [Gammaproteobacteria bacterium]
MTSAPSDPDRRLWLTVTSVAGGAGLVATAVPFVASMSPSERARALGAPVEVDISGIKTGELKTVDWRGQPVFVLRRSKDMLDSLTRHDDLLSDPSSRRSDQPKYTINVDRSIKPEIAVMVGICTHLGCIPTFRPVPGSADIGSSWPGGFYCPCHGSKFDLAGRVFKNVPAPTNLVIPPHHFSTDGKLLIGVDPKA